MAKKNYWDDRKKTAAALRHLGTILARNGVCVDTSPISRAADQCSSNTSPRDDRWGYDISNLVFNISAPKGTLPNTLQKFRAELSVSVSGHFSADTGDQFTKLEVNLEKFAQGQGGASLQAAWHFDRHIIDVTKDDRHITDDIHPLYHFQFGGARMTKIHHRLGDTLLLDPPRLMHPPMDGILAIDFVLANYAGKIWKILRDDEQYKRLVIPQFEKIWKPYFSAVTDSWINPRTDISGYLCPFI